MLELPATLNHRFVDTDKRDYGHALLIAGGYGRMGCALLAAKAALRAGAGLLTMHVARRCVDVAQTGLPEAMLSLDRDEVAFSSLPENLDHFDALAIGPGLGFDPKTQRALVELLRVWGKRPLVVDADAITHLACLSIPLPAGAVFTPHEREYARLFGDAKPLEMARKHNIVIVKKAHCTKVVAPPNNIFINNTGNPGMATAGSGDVLTGVILGFLAQGMDAYNAAKYGVIVHGKAGDRVAQKRGQAAVIASDIIEALNYLD